MGRPMGSYNGFTQQQRSKAGAWIRSQIKQGLRIPATVCCGCGQSAGVIDNHAEDYSEPFGDHLFRFPMCYACHMMIHCRFRSSGAWRTYVEHVESGELLRVPFMKRDWGRLTQLLDGPLPADFMLRDSAHPAPEPEVLTRIDAGEFAPGGMIPPW